VGDGDDELLRRCQQGEETALDGLVRRYQQRIFHLACRVLGDAALAEEATAQTLVKIWSRCGQWRGQSAAGTWIYRIAVRTVLDVQRSQNRWWRRWARPVPVEMHDGRPQPDEAASEREQLQQRERRVQAALRQLPETDRVLVHLYYFEKKTLGEIEMILGVPKGNLKMRLARARQKLRSLLGGTEDD
jgi:RNA polymerase sigma-70 factor (ECF subfamily)